MIWPKLPGSGQGVDRTGRISPEGEQRALAVLDAIEINAAISGSKNLSPSAPARLRDAENSAEVRARWRNRLGFDVRVISGAKKRPILFWRCSAACRSRRQEILVIDIGGGSTEFIRGNDVRCVSAVSIDIGSVRLTERFLHSDPVRADEVASHDHRHRSGTCTVAGPRYLP